MKQAAATCLLLAVTLPASSAGPIYRCGSEYSQVPCAGGAALELSDPRSAAQRAEAKRIAAEDRRRASGLERERRAQEKRIKPSLAGGLNGRPAPAEEGAASRPTRGKGGKIVPKAETAPPKDFVAVEPAKPKPRRSP
jgi:hypothetical protein